MAVSYKVIAQSAPTDATATTVYTVPAGTQIIVSRISVTALVTTRPTITVDVRPDGATAGNSTKLVKDAIITPGKEHAFGRGVTLDASDVLTLTCSAGNTVCMQVFGVVIAP